MRRLAGVLQSLTVVLFLTIGFALAGTDDGGASRREKIDAIADRTVRELTRESVDGKELFERAHGYAVFSSTKVAPGISGGSGSGVAVDKTTDDRTYMRMGTEGLGLGLGGRQGRIVLLFETAKAFNDFLEGVASKFRDGVAVYRISTNGIAAEGDISGARYWKSGKLN